MNETMTQTTPIADGVDPEYWRECMSALVDGELSPAEVVELMAAIEQDPQLQAVWARYQTISPLVMRANAALPSLKAANDPAFWRRWAVAASIVAISTFAFGVFEPSASSNTTLAHVSGQVWVSSAAGSMMRDPALEELLQEHREWGDGGALQASTGFLRSATLHTTP